MIKEYLTGILDFYLYSSIHIALAATLLILQTYLLLDIDIDYHYLAFIFSSTVFLYALHNILGVFTPQEEVIRDKLETIRRLRVLLVAMIIVFGLISVYTFFNLTIDEIIAIVFFAFISVWYVIPLFGKRLRDYPIIKIFLVALVWAAISTLIPFYKSDVGLTTRILVFIEKYLFVFAIAIPFDIRDIEFDCSRKVKTIPNKFGIKKSIIFAVSALAFSILITIYLIETNTYQFNRGLAVIIGYLFTIYIVINSGNKKSDYYFTGIVDGLPILNFLLVLFSYHLFE